MDSLSDFTCPLGHHEFVFMDCQPRISRTVLQQPFRPAGFRAGAGLCSLVAPILILLTFPLTLLTLGLFILVINALMIMLVASLVQGFKVSGFWTAFFVSIFIALCTFVIEMFLPSHASPLCITPTHPLFRFNSLINPIFTLDGNPTPIFLLFAAWLWLDSISARKLR